MTQEQLSVGVGARNLARSLVVLAVLAGAPGLVAAAPTTPVGRWKTIDDSSGKAKSIVEIYDRGGKLYGKIIKLILEPGEDPNPKCDKCKGDKKDKPVIGMVILEGLWREGDEWKGGTILDPDNGKTYRCKLKLEKGKLKVRGYIGVSLLGRTQYWHPAQ
ncbi:MAG: DUF2147 domain-containing protein [Deltaproteobacteria bacterium]|nr:DUF2147 domain-containing protein [Deltaproteobacteria bacterium]